MMKQTEEEKRLKRRQRQNTPERKARRAELRRSPRARERNRERHQRPERHARHLESQKRYRQKISSDPVRADQRRKYMREYKRRRNAEGTSHRHTLRQEVITLLGSRCARCDWTDPRALQIDHVKGNGAQLRRDRGLTGRGGDGTGAGKELKELRDRLRAGEDVSEDYQLLCCNHNWVKRYENHEHGGRRLFDD